MIFVDTGAWFARFVPSDPCHDRVKAATDRTSKIVVDDLGVKTAVALDDHFRQFGIDVVP